MLAASGLGLATLFALSARFWWAFDLFSHFRLQYLIAAAAFGVVALAVQARPAAAVLAVVALVNGWRSRICGWAEQRQLRLAARLCAW
jgi:hypothetical protein